MSASNEPEAEQTEPSRLADAIESNEPLATSSPQCISVSRHAHSKMTSTHRDRGGLPRRSLWNRIWRRTKRAVRVLIPAPTQHKDGDIWTKVGYVAIPIDDGHEREFATTIKLDPGCEKVNLISTRLMRKVGKLYDTSTGVDIGTFVDGKRCQSLGTVEVRWYTKGYDMRFEEATCHVVDSDIFELLIGQVDISRLQLFKPNRDRIGQISALFPIRPTVKVKDILQQDDAAKAARAKEKEDKVRREKEEEEKNK